MKAVCFDVMQDIVLCKLFFFFFFAVVEQDFKVNFIPFKMQSYLFKYINPSRYFL